MNGAIDEIWDAFNPLHYAVFAGETGEIKMIVDKRPTRCQAFPADAVEVE